MDNGWRPPGAEFTPGPWRAERGEIWADDDCLGTIYRTEAWSSGDPVTYDDQANLALIVAAPDMIEALMNLENVAMQNMPESAWRLVCLAVYKATGIKKEGFNNAWIDQKTKFRRHRGGLHESMQTLVEISSFAELVTELNKELKPYGGVSADTVWVERYGGADKRIGWHETWAVFVQPERQTSRWIIGFTDGPLNDE